MNEAMGNEEEGKMSLMAHLAELRTRLIYSIGAIFLLFFLCYWLANPIFDILTRPLALLWQNGADSGEGGNSHRLIFTALHEKFFTNVKLAFWAACFLAFPVIASQIWVFIAPGLYKNEKRAFLPFIIATPILFIAGAAFVYFLVMPMAWQFFLGFEQSGGSGALAIEAELKVSEYLSLVMRLIFAFGIAFELPIVLLLLMRVGILIPEKLAEKRRYAIVMAFVAAAILTPPDPLSQISLALPIILLFEASLFIGKRLYSKK